MFAANPRRDSGGDFFRELFSLGHFGETSIQRAPNPQKNKGEHKANKKKDYEVSVKGFIQNQKPRDHAKQY